MERYSRQILYSNIGEEGQTKLGNSQIVVIGCGALGTVISNNLARAGVGYIKLIDRDYVELSNLQRQTLFDEDDLNNELPKAVAAQRKLQKINSDITIESEIVDINPSNILRICKDADLILDGTDNFHTRYLINDAALKLNIPWIYGAAIGSIGMTYNIIPNETPCLRCVFGDMPPIGSVDTCDTVGVLNSITNIVASLQSVEAIKILTGKHEDISNKLRFIDAWGGEYEQIDVSKNEDCIACGNSNYEFLNDNSADAIYLCGSNSIQVNYKSDEIQIDSILSRLDRQEIPYRRNSFYTKFIIDNVQFTLFNDGRAILKGISDINKAKTLYSKYIGV